ncbi:hypothetical protein ABH944_004683 [Caballeronia udeis]|jgi:Domain of unknown function (DUF4148)|uniref:Purine nucleoside phosphorylase n=1 Tax=Caballeronia udeis TaxID=1232866 RepID=A0ABW8MMR7_9BURK
MKTTLKLLVLSQLLIVSTASMAEGTLTAQQCNDYPFVHTQGPVTHAQVMNELYELEAAGYDASAPNAPYPDNLNDAQNRLSAEYARDCKAQ